MRRQAKGFLAFSAIAFAASAYGQAYECKDAVTGAIYQRHDPCPSGTDARRPPQPQRIQQKEEDRRRENTQNDYASMRGEVRAGMSQAQVQRAWGNPHRIVTDATDSIAAERWVYACPIQRGLPMVTTRVYFKDGQVTKIHKAC